MIKKICSIFLILNLLGQSLLFAQTISDISPKSNNYQAIKLAVKNHYLSVNSNKEFTGDSFLKRSDAAIMAYKLDKAIQSNKLSLTKVQIDELTKLSRTFKPFILETEKLKKSTASKLSELEHNQKVIINDLTNVNESLKNQLISMKKEHNDHVLYLSVGIITAGILGIMTGL
ncbi:hypothetical protein HOG98_06080 [bacterium]|jgi:hypothetical protein|nr:hypothetical protein [bacterium]